MNPWPLGERWIVTYVLNGHAQSTRHVAGCGVLKRARRQADAALTTRNLAVKVERVAVVEEDRYMARMVQGGFPEPEDHSCVKGAAAATASFRFADGEAK